MNILEWKETLINKLNLKMLLKEPNIQYNVFIFSRE